MPKLLEREQKCSPFKKKKKKAKNLELWSNLGGEGLRGEKAGEVIASGAGQGVGAREGEAGMKWVPSPTLDTPPEGFRLPRVMEKGHSR